MPSTALHSPLKHPKDIRLLRIRPQRSGVSVEITLDIFRLDSDVRFTALSYVWGNPMPSSEIICNGYSVPITRNLWDVLSQLRKEEHDGLLWVDAICINQKDNEEKGVQVSMMRDIYKRAANVIFWLGTEENYDRDAVRLMNVFYESNQHHSDLEPLRGRPLNQLGLPVIDDGWFGWASLSSRPWFGRVWIVQEFLNAKQSFFMSGALIIPTELLVRCAHATGVCAAIGEAFTRYSEGIVNIRQLMLRPFALSLDQITRSIAGIDDVRIVDLWTKSQLLEAKDPRDRVFALLSTQTAVSMDMIDYNKSEETVYTDIAKVALTLPVPATEWYRRSSCKLKANPGGNDPQRVSRFLACRNQKLHSSSLPSWVPDWRPAAFRFVPLTRYYTGSAYFEHHYEHAKIDGKTLQISGIIVDNPSMIIDSMPYMETDRPYVIPADPQRNPTAQSWCKRMLDWQIMCYLGTESVGSFSTREELLEAFYRTMAFDALPDRSATPVAEYVAGFQKLHSTLAYGASTASTNRLTLPNVGTPTYYSVIYESVFQELSAGRKFCVTRQGSLAWVPRDTRLGDSLCFLAGCAVPFVIRPIGESFELLGDCYLHNIKSDESITFAAKPRMLQFQ